mgnify:FL=1
MADDPMKRGAQDRRRVSGSEEHELRYFAEQNGVSMDEARKLIAAHGNDRATLEAEAKKLRR